MEKRLVIAIALSIVIILSFQSMVVKQKKARETVAPVGEIAAPVQTKAPEIAPYPVSKPSFEEKLLEASTDKYIMTFSNVGGSIKAIRLKEYKNLGTDKPLDLVDIENPEEYIFALSEPSSPGALDMSEYSVAREDGAVVYSKTAGDFKIIKKYILRNNKNGIELQVFIKNISSSRQPFRYKIVGGSGLTEEKAQDKAVIAATAKVNEKKVNYKRPRNDERITNSGAVNWIALHNKYFSLIVKPLGQAKDQFHYLNRDGLLVTGVETDISAIAPGATAENRYLLYAGPSNIPVLKEFGYELDETIDYGFFGGISKILITAMRLCYNIVRNWGVSIILLAILLNIVLFPLTVKSFKSMQKMQELQPQMEKLKAQYKGNPQKLNQEVMELYKKYGINPLSGCLPLLLQMPIFFALYQALMKSIELRNSSFLWIKDLSSPEAIPIPITLPIIGNTINILPLAMVAAMVFQQKMSTRSTGAGVTEEQKQQQKMMLIIMPIMFGFLFYNMPSGLVLYWIVSTVMTISEQALVLKKA
ncbi:MAG: membrane protein insertase YidC [Candidatus Omnitrophota bacterium]